MNFTPLQRAILSFLQETTVSWSKGFKAGEITASLPHSLFRKSSHEGKGLTRAVASVLRALYRRGLVREVIKESAYPRYWALTMAGKEALKTFDVSVRKVDRP